MKAIRYLLVLSFLLAAGTVLANTPPVVTDVVAVQRPHTALIDVTYNLTDADGDLCHVSLWYSLDGGVTWDHECATVWGDVGHGITPGINLVVTWDAGVDVPDFTSEQFTIRVYADDGSGAIPEGFVYIPPGTFVIGSPAIEPGRVSNEGPQHYVTLTKGFYMSKYEVTEERWYEVMGGTPTNSQLPMTWVSWDMAVQFCNGLSVQDGLTPAYTIHGPDGNVTWNQNADGYRLPTEAEWEYACRATTTFAFNNNTNCLSSDTEANYNGQFPLTGCPTGIGRDALTEVGAFPANQWGLYDMHGNVWEFVWCGARTYSSSSQVDPVHNVGPGAPRLIRGGNAVGIAQFCRSAFRTGISPTSEDASLGFRIVRSVF